LARRVAALLLGVFVCARASLASAHDFWLQLNQYWVHPDASNAMTLQVGHGEARQRSPIPARRIERFQLISPEGAVLDLRKQLRLGQAAEDAEFRVDKPGTYLLLLQTDDRAEAHLPSLRFNDYLKGEGLTPALEQRARLHRMDADGSERYSRCAKSIVQVGPPSATARSNITKPIGLPLEIVPETNPYEVPRSTTLPLRVIYLGRPLPGALVKLTNLEHDAAPFAVRLTDAAGRASFSMPSSGSWLLNVIWTRPLPRSDATDFETVFSSLSFGFPMSQIDH
jgi:uncharacterized GH25 family protein